MRRPALALLAAALLVAGGCGGDATDESASRLLQRGFATDVGTGILRLDAAVELEGGPVEGAFRLELEGPFRSSGPTELPEADMEFRASGAGQGYEGRAILTRANAWVEFRGETYEVGEELWARAREPLRAREEQPETLLEAGVDPMDWLDDLETEGDEEVHGTPTTKASARVDVERMLSDFNKLSSEPQEPLPFDPGDFVEDVEFEAWIGEDGIWRRLSAAGVFRVPQGERDSVGGVEGGKVSLEIELDDPNEPVEIEGPTGARRLDELLRRLGIPPGLLLGPGFSAPAPG